ncbi:uncharacterized protein BYT42DRAFT_504579 [Radiomyces spectabilis]|uniref:uncharacterized protein n=1 Tax=Radiomyces spectabilis TaxID=64574 RepID=UPI00221F201E|nr:uncharacterized protein BYT42DRAFT_504579 [Radiomyces spectabilis]KAI8367678.1 hypothetical protein BYT42DRAFT_504579 [Radiomyces spectabilis]
MTLKPTDKAQIYAMKKMGADPEMIAKQFKISSRRIFQILKEVDERGTFERKQGSGRPRKLTERDIRRIKHYAKKNRRAPLAEIQQNVAPHVH